jgi:hypothetical protein
MAWSFVFGDAARLTDKDEHITFLVFLEILDCLFHFLGGHLILVLFVFEHEFESFPLDDVVTRLDAMLVFKIIWA